VFIVHLPSLEVIDDDPRQAAKRLPPRFLRQHHPQAFQLDPFGRYTARGGTPDGSWMNKVLLLE
jgi:hypothetical protein